MTGDWIAAKAVTGYEKGKPQMLAVQTIRQKDKNEKLLFLALPAARNFRDMMVQAAKDGFHLKAISAFRTHREQRSLKRRKGELAALPGWSNHQQGLSVDIANTTRLIKGVKYRTILYWWLVRNAKRYGFYNDVADEPWHWTFKGMRDRRIKEYG